ncbi:unnamed protein product [Hymenolepis diminuta]|uniref:palmitoyl-protein hydrolase n=1 Tax=Hymenolepis diminuta TaxID=6216 RepID=A0A564YML1_HYMDI|nr:unnamed protein product [Hymenolepis diminuta]
MGNWMCGHLGKNSPVETLTCEIVKPQVEHKSTLVFLHGLGDTGRNWSQQLKKIVPPHCEIICPNAKPIEVSINQNAIMPAWFDIYGLSVESPQDEKGIAKVAEQVSQLIKTEVETCGIPLNRIVLGGFSQGGSAALFTGITASSLRGLAGVMIFSSWLPLAQQIAADNAKLSDQISAVESMRTELCQSFNVTEELIL